MKLRVLVLAAVLTIPSFAHADGSVDITLSQEGMDLADSLGITVAELEADTEAQIDEAYTVNRIDDFLRAFADATAFSSRGIGVDYASNGEGLMFGVTANVAAAVGDLGQDEQGADRPVAGVAPNFALMGGLNFKKWKKPALTVYANLFYRSGEWSGLNGSITTFGAHAQYKLFSPTEGKKSVVFKWGGLDLTAGVELSRWGFGLDAGDRIPTQNMPVEGPNGTTEIDLVSTGRFDLDSSGVVVPFEATTSLRFLYFFSLYGGASFALQAGNSKVDAELEGTLTATDPQNGDAVDMGTAAITVDGQSGPSVGRVTFLGGLQINIWKLKTFVQANFMPVRAASVAFGLRVVL